MALKFNKKNNSITGVSRPEKNKATKNLMLIMLISLTVGSIVWVRSIGLKAEESISVCMINRPVYKNQFITEDMISEYKMILGEFEKFSVVDDNGTLKTRIVPFAQVDKLIGTFAAYPIQANTYAYYSNFVKSRIDNSDSVLYAFPGKNIIPMQINTSELESFKAYLKPGDKLDITALYIEEFSEEVINQYNQVEKITYEAVKTEQVFGNIVIADMLNNNGESVLDLYESYKTMTVAQQVAKDSDPTWKQKITPVSLLVALTPEEMDTYNYYRSKKDVSFSMSMPQRAD